MKIYFVTNQKWYSRLARYLANCFDLKKTILVIDITKPYGSIYDIKYWFHDKYSYVSHIDFPLTEDEETELFQNIKNYSLLKKYDWNAYYYAMLIGIFHKIIPFNLPKRNIFANKDKAICTNVLEPLIQFFLNYNIDFRSVDLKANTPEMCEKIIRDGLKNQEKIFEKPENRG